MKKIAATLSLMLASLVCQADTSDVGAEFHEHAPLDQLTKRSVVAESDRTGYSGGVTTPSYEPMPLLSAPEIAAVQFKPRMPLADESLESALQDAEFFLKSLRRDVEVIKRYPQLKFEVLGFTDAAECRAAQCESLATIRAQVVYDWLRAHGVPTASLKGPFGRGSAMPLDIGDTEEGRARNRRVEINLNSD